MSKSSNETARLEARVVQLSSTIQVLEQKILDQEDAYHRDLNLIKQQLAELHLLYAQNPNITTKTDGTTPLATPKLNLSLADIVSYAEYKLQQNGPNSQHNDIYNILVFTAKSVDDHAQFRIVEDLTSLIPSLSKCPQFIQQYQNVLLSIATKKDIHGSDSTVVISFLQSVGFPLLHQTITIPTLKQTLFVPLGEIDSSTKNFISYHGLSQIQLLQSILTSYPLSLSLNTNADTIVAIILGVLPLLVRIDYRLLSTFKTFCQIDSNGFEIPPTNIEQRSGAVAAIHNFLTHKARDLNDPSYPKFTFYDFYYWLLFISNALYQANQLEVFNYRHPLINFLLDDDVFFQPTTLKSLNDFLSNTFIFEQLTQDAHDYQSFAAIYKRQFNAADCLQPTKSKNPQQYLKLATNCETFFSFKWNQSIARIINKELTL